MDQSSAPDEGVLFQEYLADEPFWMLITCILINRTHWRQTKVVLDKLRARCNGPKALINMPVSELTDILRPLGLNTRRASAIRRFCLAWVDDPPQNWRDVYRMPGCGKYAAQSWQIFVQRRKPTDLVEDLKLRWYLEQHPELV